MFGPEEVGNTVEGVVVDEDRAEQRLFRLEIVASAAATAISARSDRFSSAAMKSAIPGATGQPSRRIVVNYRIVATENAIALIAPPFCHGRPRKALANR
jgi:hypothetical protein